MTASCPTCNRALPGAKRSERVQAAIDRCLAGEKPFAVAHDLGIAAPHLYKVLKAIRRQNQPL